MKSKVPVAILCFLLSGIFVLFFASLVYALIEHKKSIGGCRGNSLPQYQAPLGLVG